MLEDIELLVKEYIHEKHDSHGSLDIPVDPELIRLNRIQYLQRIFTSVQFNHRGKVCDFHVHIGGLINTRQAVFGEIIEIFRLSNTERFFLVLRKYERVTLEDKNGNRMKFPVNQIPFEVPSTYNSDEMLVFEFMLDLKLLKACVVDRTFAFERRVRKFFCVQPDGDFVGH